MFDGVWTCSRWECRDTDYEGLLFGLHNIVILGVFVAVQVINSIQTEATLFLMCHLTAAASLELLNVVA